MEKHPVIMILNEIKHTKITIPDNYRFEMYRKEYKQQWIELMVKLNHFLSKEEALRYFNENFLDINEMREKILFVVDKEGQVCGTCMLWEGNHFGSNRLRVHWMGVDPNHQGNRLGSGLLQKIIEIYQRMNKNDPLYLVTSNECCVAIKMYIQFGFIPYKGERPKNFRKESNNFEEENEIYWREIFSRIEN